MVTLKRMRSIVFGGWGGGQATEGRYPRNRIGYGAATAGQRARIKVRTGPVAGLRPSNLQPFSVEIKASCFGNNLEQLPT